MKLHIYIYYYYYCTQQHKAAGIILIEHVRLQQCFIQ